MKKIKNTDCDYNQVFELVPLTSMDTFKFHIIAEINCQA